MMSCWASSRTCEPSRTMPHAAAKQNGVPADSPCLRRTVQEPIRHSPELGIVPEIVPSEVHNLRVSHGIGKPAWNEIREDPTCAKARVVEHLQGS